MRYFSMMWLPLAVGFLIGGMIDYYIPREYISKHLAAKRKRVIFYSVGLGFLMSACSHGIIALSMELHKKGASGPAVVSFLLASPWASLPITFLLIGFFGAKAFLIIGSALGIALMTGFIFQGLERLKWIESNSQSVVIEEGFSIRRDIKKRWQSRVWNLNTLSEDLRGVWQGVQGLSEMVLFWILLGFILAGFSAAFVPAHFFQQYLGPTFAGLMVTLIFATVIEVCSEGTSPLAFELYRQTGALGNAFVFLMGGVVTDFTEIALVWKNLGKKTAAWLLMITLPQVIFFGWLMNFLR